MRNKIYRYIVLIIFCFILSWVQSPYAESTTPREYLIKAGFLYNFAKFVEWPDDAFADKSIPLNLCILGRDPFGPALRSVEGETFMGRKLVVRRFSRLREIDNCHILFISSSEKKRLPAILARMKGKQILSVADMEGFARRGGIINLIKVKDRIRFEINVDAARRAGLKISSKLLNLATIIREGRGAGQQ
ncbi:MAG: YfiR family protein [Deferribacteres bacterium]|nr:YfiR family protein [Deferribacteres bacterium]